MELLCGKCERSRYVYQVTKLDSKTNKTWKVFKCSKCEFNVDLEEVKDGRGLGKIQKDRY